MTTFSTVSKTFSGVRNDLEHILDRIHVGESNLGNLISTGDNKHIFQFGDKEVDISFESLDLVDSLSSSINHWLISNVDKGSLTA